MREVFAIGIGMHPWGKFPSQSIVDLGAFAVREALEDSGLQWTDITAAVAGLYAWGGAQGFNAGSALAGRLGETGIPITNVYNFSATATSVFRSAYLTVASGEQDICLAIGADISPKGFLTPLGTPDPKDPDYLRFSVGLANPAYWALECRKRMEEIGTTEQHLAQAKVAASRHGALNPKALYRKLFTTEEVLSSPLVATL